MKKKLIILQMALVLLPCDSMVYGNGNPKGTPHTTIKKSKASTTSTAFAFSPFVGFE